MKLLKYFKKIIEASKKGDRYNPLNVYGKCPVCGESIIKIQEYYVCINKMMNGCTYQRPAKFNGEEIEYSEVLKFEKYKKMLESGFLSEPSSKHSLNISMPKIETVEDKENRESLGSCPSCGDYIKEYEKEYGCVNCEFTSRKYFYNTLITPDTIRTLLENSPSSLLDFKKKDGSIYSSKIKMDLATGNYSFYKEKNNRKADFNKETEESKVKKEKKIHDSCPLCNKKVVIGKKSYGCMGVLDGSCNFTIPFEFECMPIEESDLDTLLRGSTLTLYRFDNPDDEIDIKLDSSGNLERVPF